MGIRSAHLLTLPRFLRWRKWICWLIGSHHAVVRAAGDSHQRRVAAPARVEPGAAPRRAVYLGMGDKFDPARGDGLKADGYLHLPKDIHHYEWTDDDTVIQLSGIGPVGMT
jgi:hypothetical protein